MHLITLRNSQPSMPSQSLSPAMINTTLTQPGYASRTRLSRPDYPHRQEQLLPLTLSQYSAKNTEQSTLFQSTASRVMKTDAKHRRQL
jgi:hypothetical protein